MLFLPALLSPNSLRLQAKMQVVSNSRIRGLGSDLPKPLAICRNCGNNEDSQPHPDQPAEVFKYMEVSQATLFGNAESWEFAGYSKRTKNTIRDRTGVGLPGKFVQKIAWRNPKRLLFCLFDLLSFKVFSYFPMKQMSPSQAFHLLRIL